MSNDVTVNIGGNTYKLQEALEAGARAIDGFGREVAGSVERTNSALAAATAYYRRMTQELNYLRDASRVMGEETANANVEWLRAAAGSSEYGDRLAYLKSQLGLLNAEQREAQSQSGTLGSALNDNVFSRFGAWNMELSAVIANFRTLSSVLMAVPNAMGRLGQMGFQYAQQGVQSAWDLNVSTERMRYGWGYLFGTPDSQGTDTSGNATALMNWISNYTYKLPFPNQDTMAAVTALGTVAGDPTGDGSSQPLTPAEIEHYLPIIADIAATRGSAAYGGRGTTLQQAAYAIRAAAYGRAFMLRQDLNIDPQELIKYGLDAEGSGMAMHINDPSTLLPALERYAEAKNLKGAAETTAQNTWWGEWSSFTDRMQYFGLRVGGTELNGTIRPGSLFASAKKDLNDLMSWMNDANNQAAIGKVADLIQNVLGGGATLAGNAVQGLLDGLQRTGAEQFLFDTVSNVAQWLSSPDTAKGAQKIGDALGGLLGPAGQTGAKAIEGILDGLKESGVGDTLLKTVKDLGVWFSDPQHQKDVQNFFEQMGKAAGGVVKALDTILTKVAQIATPLVGGGNDLIKQMQVMYGMTSQDEALLARQNPFKSPTNKDIAGMGFSQSYDWMQNISAHDWQTVVERAEHDYLQQMYGSNVSPEAKAAYAAWLQQMEDEATGNSGPTTPSYAPGYGPTIQNPGRAAQLAHRGLAALASSGGASTTNDAYTEAGQMAGHQYLAAFKTTMDTQGPATMASAVASYTTGLHAQLKDAGSTLARDLSDYVQQAVQQGIADALRNARISGNADLRQPGAFRSGGIGLGGAL